MELWHLRGGGDANGRERVVGRVEMNCWRRWWSELVDVDPIPICDGGRQDVFVESMKIYLDLSGPTFNDGCYC